jgi:ribosomal protein S18 acetylase RimI-like enzyme
MTTRRSGRAEVRPLQLTDRERWNELWRGYLEFYRHPLPPDITELTWRRLLDPAHPFQGLVAIDGQPRIVGIVHFHVHASTWAREGYCYLEDLFVDADCRGRGTGRALIEAVYRAADERGAERVYWHTQDSNAQAQVLYRELAELTAFVQYQRRPTR